MEPEMKIVVSKDGPYLVYGGIPLSIQTVSPNEDGLPWDWVEGRSFATEQDYKLCRCGKSEGKPFCDDACKETKFDGSETASRGNYAHEAKTYEGPELILRDSESLCAHARFCMAAGTVWHMVKESDVPTSRRIAVREANHCPSGRLSVTDARGKQIEDKLKPSIGVVEDSTRGCSGPLWVRGGIRIESEDGTRYEVRNRVTLCRCGASENKPFCNGSHRQIKFNDGFLESPSGGKVQSPRLG